MGLPGPTASHRLGQGWDRTCAKAALSGRLFHGLLPAPGRPAVAAGAFGFDVAD
jgi:hypothetical protein